MTHLEIRAANLEKVVGRGCKLLLDKPLESNSQKIKKLPSDCSKLSCREEQRIIRPFVEFHQHLALAEGEKKTHSSLTMPSLLGLPGADRSERISKPSVSSRARFLGGS